MLWREDSYGHAQKLWFVFGVPTVDGNNHGLGFKGWSPLCPGAETVATSSEYCPHPHPLALNLCLGIVHLAHGWLLRNTGIYSLYYPCMPTEHVVSLVSTNPQKVKTRVGVEGVHR